MDATYLQQFLSRSSREATRSEIRELLKLISQPEIISLAGGLPSPDIFPLEQLSKLLPGLIADHGAEALQYGATEGNLGLRKRLVRLMVETEGPAFAEATPENVLITSGSQQALDLCSRVFVSPGDAVVCGLPSYLGALGAFTACGARLCGIPLDDGGMRTDLLEQRLVELRRCGVHPKFIYTVPDFQNPSGVTLSLERRRELLSIAREFDVLVVEDSPYRMLRYVGDTQPSLYSLDREGRVISLFTFSKILFPGLRLGWVMADPEILGRLVVAKQPVDLCTSGLSQLVAREYLDTGWLPGQLARVRGLYAKKRDAMLVALDREFDPAWGVRWTRPEGGLFLWMSLPAATDARELLEQALEKHVAFVAGRAFHCDGSGANTLRLNFSYPPIEQLSVAVSRLAGCVGSMAERSLVGAAEVEGEHTTPLLVSGEHTLDHLSWNLAMAEIVE